MSNPRVNQANPKRSTRCRLKMKEVVLATSIASVFGSAHVISQSPDEEQERFEEAVLVVSPRVLARERADSINPVLSYDVEFFQRFEPTNLQEMLKRVPGINVDKLFPSSENFTDTEALNFGFRGSFGDGAGQILINGRRIPGIDTVNSVAFSSIPVELVKEIQVIRATSADIDAQGYGLTINILLKDGATVPEGKRGLVRVNARSVSGEPGGNLSGTFRGKVGSGYDYSLSYSFDKDTRRSELLIDERRRGRGADSPVDQEVFLDDTLVKQSQTGVNATLGKQFVRGGKFSVHTYLFDKDRDDSTDSVFTDAIGSLDALLTNIEELSIKGVAGKFVIPFYSDSESNVTVKVSYDESEFDYEFGTYFDDVIFLDSQDLERSELKLGAEVNFLNSASVDFSLGISGEINEFSVASESLFEEIGGDNDIENRIENLDQSRFDAYLKYELQMSNTFLLSLGYRYETTMNERSAENIEGVFSRDVENSLASGSVWWKAHSNHDFRLSYSENVFRPDERFLLPGLYTVGASDDEYRAAGTDVTNSKYSTWELNYDYHFAKRRGIFGISVFEKRSDDLPDEVSLEGEGAVRSYISANQAYLLPILDAQAEAGAPVEFIEYLQDSDIEIVLEGVEVDFSVPMAIIGLPNLSVSSNISYFNRRGNEEGSENSTSANLSIDHKLGAGFSYGFSYNTKSDEKFENFSDDGSEFITSIFERDPAMDLFIEKRFGDSFLVRLVAENVTDASDQVIVNSRFADESTPFFSSRNRVNSDTGYQIIFRGAF